MIQFLFFTSSLVFIFKRLLRYLRYFQQDAYIPKRFLIWIWEQKAFDKWGTISLSLSALISYFSISSALALATIFLFITALLEPNPLHKGKIKLKMTSRAKRIFISAFSLCLFLEFLIFFTLSPSSLVFWIAQASLFQTLPLTLLGAFFILSFDEKKRQKTFIQEAKNKLKAQAPFTIGITGSYGKTSTKEALGQLLQLTCGPTFWPPKGINTEMGMTRSIREELKGQTHFAVFEMGAYGLGSIQKLTELTPPQAAIITGVGLAHLDRFKTTETIYQAKSELAQALPKNGILVCNGDNLGARRMAKEHEKQTTLLYGIDNSRRDLACCILPESYSPTGSQFTLTWKGKCYKGFTPLIGRTALLNAAGAFTMACALGADPEWAIAAFSVFKPVDNRLEIKEEAGKLYIKDAYNSNPEGFLSALEVLQKLPAKKRLLMTPGMIELADQQEALHVSLGKEAALVCDQVILVGETNRKSLKEGLLLGGMKPERIFEVSNRAEAFQILNDLFEKGDALLIENDLPDLYEREEFF